MNNLTWLYEHDETFGNVCYVFGEHFNGDDTRDTREWLMAEHAHLTIDEPQSINNEILSEPSSERNPFFTVADRLGVNCADRTDERIAERMLEELEHAWMELPRDVDGNVLHEGDSVVWVDPEWDDEPTIVVGFLDHRSVFTSKKGWRPDTMTVTDELRLKGVPKEPVTLEVRDDDGNTASETPISTCMSDYEHEPAPKLDMAEYQEPTPYEPYEPADTREKLEADILMECEYTTLDGFATDVLKTRYDNVREWLDRQAAITRAEDERICDTCEWPSPAAMPDQEAYDRIAELQSELDKRDKGIERLKRRRDELQKQVNGLTAELERSKKKVMAYTNQAVHMYDDTKKQAQLDVQLELDEIRFERDRLARKLEKTEHARDLATETVDELQAKLKAAQDVNERQDIEWANLKRENVNLAHDMGECMAERDGLRERIADIPAIAKGDE